MRPLALFDLDGTITNKDTFVEFLVFVLGHGKAWTLLATSAPLLILARLGLVADDLPKRFVLRKAFRGMKQTKLEVMAERFVQERMPAITRPGALERVKELQVAQARVIIVTASCGLWVAPWCTHHGLEMLATELEVIDGEFTGELACPNCKGEEKVTRIRALLDPNGFDPVEAYGDTGSDEPMLALAGTQHRKPFR